MSEPLTLNGGAGDPLSDSLLVKVIRCGCCDELTLVADLHEHTATCRWCWDRDTRVHTTLVGAGEP